VFSVTAGKCSQSHLWARLEVNSRWLVQRYITPDSLVFLLTAWFKCLSQFHFPLLASSTQLTARTEANAVAISVTQAAMLLHHTLPSFYLQSLASHSNIFSLTQFSLHSLCSFPTFLSQFTRWCHLRSVPAHLPVPSEDLLIPLLLQHWLILLTILWL